MSDSKEILTLAIEIGKTLLENGGEIYRVEDTLKRILSAFEIKNYNIYVLSNVIFASADEESQNACCMIRQVPLNEIHLGKIAAINQLSRELCAHKYELSEAWEQLKQCRKIPAYPPFIQSLSCGIGCASFCLIFGGNLLDAFCVLFLGVCLQYFRLNQKKKNASKFMVNIIGSAFLTSASLLFFQFNQYFPQTILHQDMIVTGGIMPLVPGIALTTSIRDLFNGDFLSGAIHLLDALLTAVSIAVGVDCIIIIYRYFSGGVSLL